MGAASCCVPPLNLVVRRRWIRRVRLSGAFALGLPIAFASGCSTTSRLSDTQLCQQMAKYVAAVPSGTGSFVQLERRGAWLVNHSKACFGPDGDGPARALCSWLLDRTSTEFMEATVTLAVACVQGQRIHGYLGNTGIESWEGKLRSYSPRFDTADASIAISWRLEADAREWDDYLRFEVEPE
jgi:hypothetical protein